MLLYFDKDTLQLNVRCGALEDYHPNQEIRDIVKRALDLKEKRDKFLDEVYNPEIKILLDMIHKLNVAANPQLEGLREKEKK